MRQMPEHHKAVLEHLVDIRDHEGLIEKVNALLLEAKEVAFHQGWMSAASVVEMPGGKVWIHTVTDSDHLNPYKSKDT